MESTGTHNCQPSGGAGQDGSGSHPGGGTHPSGGVGQPGGGLNRYWFITYPQAPAPGRTQRVRYSSRPTPQRKR